MKIIGLAGKAGSGKSYLAKNVFVPEGYIPLALAGSMKARLAAEGVLPPDEATGREPKSFRTRKILQVFGTELGRERFYEDVWCVTLEWWLVWFMDHGYDKFVVTDVRFPNEVEWVRSLGGVVIRLTDRGGLEGISADHKSETALDDEDLPEVSNAPGRPLSDVSASLMDVVFAHYEEEL